LALARLISSWPRCRRLHATVFAQATRLFMNREEFLRLAAAGYNRIPLACETLADFDTPLSIYLKLADAPNSYLLESVQGGEKWGRYSIIGLPAARCCALTGMQVRESSTAEVVEAAMSAPTRWPLSSSSRRAIGCQA
jgi:hypothetical protein